MHANLVRPGGLRLDRVGVDVFEEFEATIAVWRLEHGDIGVVIETHGSVCPVSTDRVTAENDQPEVGEEGNRRFEATDGDADIFEPNGHASSSLMGMRCTLPSYRQCSG